MIMIVVMIFVAVAPGPIFFLLSRRQLPEIPMFITVVFARPLMIISVLVVIPDVVIAIVGIVDTVVMMMRARCAEHRKSQHARQET